MKWRNSNLSERWNILYRGPLSSCNYACSYCPFAKTSNTAAELRTDEACLNRFCDWIEEQADREIGVLITPWGEAMIHPSYQRAMTRLSHLPNVYRIAIQTNLSGQLDWLAEADRQTLALWTTWHPTQCTMEAFLGKCHELAALNVRFSVGVVGFNEERAAIAELKEQLPPGTTLWINAYKDVADYYSATDLDAFTALDPLFPTNTIRHPSRGLPCRAGSTSFSVDGGGDAYRCHFIKSRIGNIYDPDFRTRLSPSPQPCTNETCGCHIGYVHLTTLELDQVYGDGILERIPQG